MELSSITIRAEIRLDLQLLDFGEEADNVCRGFVGTVITTVDRSIRSAAVGDPI
jgi:hypothetical protein